MIAPSSISLRIADICSLQVDAIVNAANNSLLGGGGVDGAIHRAAGPELLSYCAGLGGCKTGEAKLTPGFQLPARYILHTVGPIWKGGQYQEEALLASCYRRCLELAAACQDLQSLAFPCISTGVYRFPKDRAAEIALHSLQEGLQQLPRKLEITLCCFSEADALAYRKLGIPTG